VAPPEPEPLELAAELPELEPPELPELEPPELEPEEPEPLVVEVEPPESLPPLLEEAVTGAVGPEYADADPYAFFAVTRTRRVDPTSALTSLYEAPVAPPIVEQPDPNVHRSHR